MNTISLKRMDGLSMIMSGIQWATLMQDNGYSAEDSIEIFRNHMDEPFSSSEALDMIVQYYGGFGSGYEVKQAMRTCYHMDF